MRLHVFVKRFVVGICSVLLAISMVAAQSADAPEAVLLTDDFNYTGLLTANGWSVHSGAGTNPMSTTGGLSYTGHPGSAVGNAALVGNAGGEDVNKPLSAEVTADGATVYFSFLVNVNDAAAAKTGDYFIHLGDRVAPDNFTFFAARVFARITASGVNFGVSNTSTPTYGATNFNKNQTYLIIVKYTISASGNDPLSMWVLASGVPATEAAAGTPEVTVTDTNGQSIIDAVALRQGSGTTSTQQVVDAIRVGTTWADVTGGATTPSANASQRTFVARLTGAAERPNPVTTNAYGFGRLTLNDAENQITVSANWENLTSNTISGHIHGNATTEQTAPILFDLQPPTGATSGSVTNKTFAVTAQQVADLRAGLWYINIHSSNFTAGEIRGQLVPQTQPADFNGDGKTDYGIARAAGNTLQWWISNNGSTNTDQVVNWGILADFLTPGDYDGDRKADIAVFRNTGAAPGFFILQSSNSTTRFVRFGQNGDRPVVADYDGDGRDNVAIYRNAQAAGGQSVFWYFGDRGAVANQQVPVPWGTAGDFPVLGDFTGDGRADFMVQRNGVFYLHPSNGTFDFNNNTNNQVIPFGLPGDSAVNGDFDGDGISDIAVIRTEGGAMAWYVRPSSGNGSYYGLTFGASTDNPVQGDYDGDGKTDQATFRNGATPAIFFSRGSLNGSTIVRQYGMMFDQALINGSLSLSRPELVE